MGAIPNIFCPEIQKYFEYVKANNDSFFPTEIQKSFEYVKLSNIFFQIFCNILLIRFLF